MAYAAQSASPGNLSAFISSNAASIKQEWDVVQPLLANHPTGKNVLAIINQAPNFTDVIEAVTQALAQYKLFPDLDEFIDTLQICTSELAKPVEEVVPKAPTAMENLWLIPTFDEDVRMVNRKPSLAAFQKQVERAFSMIGRPSPQEIEQKMSSKLSVPATTLSSSGYATLTASSVQDRTSKLEDAKRTMFTKKPMAETGIPSFVNSFTPYQSSFATSEPTAAVSGYSMPFKPSPGGPSNFNATGGHNQGFSQQIQGNANTGFQMPSFVPSTGIGAGANHSNTDQIVNRCTMFEARQFGQNLTKTAPELLEAFGEIVKRSSDRSNSSSGLGNEVMVLLAGHKALQDQFSKWFSFTPCSPLVQRKNEIRQRLTLRKLARLPKNLGADNYDDDDDDDEFGEKAHPSVGSIAFGQSIATSGGNYAQISVVTLTGKHIILQNQLGPNSTIMDIKRCVNAREGIPEDMQRLIFAGKQLEDEQTLAHYSIQEGDKMHLVLRLRLGATPSVTRGKAAPAKKAPKAVPQTKVPVPAKKMAVPAKKAKAAVKSDKSPQKSTKAMQTKKKVKKDEYSDSGSSSDSDGSDGSDGSDSEGPTTTTKKYPKKTPVKRVLRTKVAEPSTGFGASSSAASSSSFFSQQGGVKPSALWEKFGTVWMRGSKKVQQGASKVAAFDMDQTLISVKSGSKFPKDYRDWQWMCEAVVPKIKDLQSQGFRIAIVTNQNGIQTGSQRAEDILSKIDAIAALLGETEMEPIVALVATGKDQYRKPSPILWDLFIEKLNKGVLPGHETFFVGDAAGRPKKDHSCADRSFASNAGLRFFTEDAFFLGASPDAIAQVPFPEDALVTEFKKTVKTGFAQAYVVPPASGPVELVLTCGMPGSGKSTIYKTVFQPKGYVHVNLDTIRNPAKCLELTATALKEGKSVVVDQTSPTSEKRASYVQIAKGLNIPVRIICTSTPMPIAKHLNTVRNWIIGQPLVPDMVYHIFLKGFQEPTTAEGFEDVIKLPFQFNATDPKLITALQWYTE